jgi:hypothetical protein
MEEGREVKAHESGIKPIPRTLFGSSGSHKALRWVGGAVLGYCGLALSGRVVWLWMGQ